MTAKTKLRNLALKRLDDMLGSIVKGSTKTKLRILRTKLKGTKRGG